MIISPSKLLYLVSAIVLLILSFRASSDQLLGTVILAIPLYAFLIFTTQFHSKNRLKNLCVRILKFISVALILLYQLSLFDTLKKCDDFPNICNNSTLIQTLLIGSIISLLLAILLGAKFFEKYWSSQMRHSDLSNPIFERYESMSPEILQQYCAEETAMLIRNIAVNKANTFIASNSLNIMLKKKLTDDVKEHITRIIYTSIFDGYKLWLSEQLSSKGSVESSSIPEFTIYAEQWDKRKFKVLEHQSQPMREVIEILQKDKLRSSQLFGLGEIPKSIELQLKKLDNSLLNLGLNVAIFEDGFRGEGAEERKDKLNKQRAEALEGLLNKIGDNDIPIYLAGEVGLYLLIDNKLNYDYDPVFIADEGKASQVVASLKELDYKVETFRDSRIKFSDPKNRKQQYWAHFYNKEIKADRYYLGSSPSIKYKGNFENTVEYKGNKINLVSPLFFIQNMNYRLSDDNPLGSEKEDFSLKTDRDSLIHSYYPKLEANDDIFYPELSDREQSDD